MIYYNGDDEKISCGYSHRTEKDEKEARERQLAEEKKIAENARRRELAWEERLKKSKCFHFVASSNDATPKTDGKITFFPDKSWEYWHKTHTNTVTSVPNVKILKMEKNYPDIWINYELA